MAKEKFDIISPDGFAISFDKTYSSLMEVARAFIRWKAGFVKQGHYSSVKHGKIHPDDLRDYCELVPVNASAKKFLANL